MPSAATPRLSDAHFLMHSQHRHWHPAALQSFSSPSGPQDPNSLSPLPLECASPSLTRRELKLRPLPVTSPFPIATKDSADPTAKAPNGDKAGLSPHLSDVLSSKRGEGGAMLFPTP